MHIFQHAVLFAAILSGIAFAELDDPQDSKLDGASLLQTHGLIGDEDHDVPLQPDTQTAWLSADKVNAMYTKEVLSKMIASGQIVTQPAPKNEKVIQYRIVKGTHKCNGPKCDVKPEQGEKQEVTHNVTVDRSSVQNLVHRQNMFSVQGPCGVSGACVRSPNYPSSYVNSDDCTISVMEDADLRILDFNTESGYDYLYVNGNRYSGSSNPITSPFRANQPIGWSADHSVTRKGWEICMSGCEALVYEHGDFTGWEVVLPVGVYDVSAMQARGAGNDAVSSLKVVGENCRVIAYEHGDFTGWQVAFPTGEYNVDAMRAMGAGNDGISSIKVELIPTPSPTTPLPTASPTPSPTEFPTVSPTEFPTALPTEFPTALPTPSPTEFPTVPPTTPLPTAPLFTLQRGDCSISGNCVTTPNYPSSYANGDACTIAVQAGTSLSMTDFDTESGYDYLYVDGNRYSGSRNPLGGGFQVSRPIEWITDGSVARRGWRICAGNGETVPAASPAGSPTARPADSPTERDMSQSPDSTASSTLPLDFRGASLLANNLGGMGPVSGSRTAMFFQGITADGTTDLLVSNLTDYVPWKAEVNGFATVNSSFAQIGLKCGESVTLRFTFLDSLTGQPKRLANFNFTMADLDRGTHGRCQESIEVADYAGWTLAPNSTVQASVDSSSGIFQFVGSEAGVQLDNPETLEGMSMDQQKRSVNFLFTNTESLTVTFSTNTGVNGYSQDPAVIGYGGRRLLFGGALS